MRIRITARNGKLVMFDVDAQTFVTTMLFIPGSKVVPLKARTLTLTVESDGQTFQEKVKIR